MHIFFKKSQINDLMPHLKLLEKTSQNQNKHKREIIKIRAKINDIDLKNTRLKETKSWFFEKMNKIDKPLKI
jgi:DNA helicase TIP49 (TBP-interacting protein)